MTEPRELDYAVYGWARSMWASAAVQTERDLALVDVDSVLALIYQEYCGPTREARRTRMTALKRVLTATAELLDQFLEADAMGAVTELPRPEVLRGLVAHQIENERARDLDPWVLEWDSIRADFGPERYQMQWHEIHYTGMYLIALNDRGKHSKDRQKALEQIHEMRSQWVRQRQELERKSAQLEQQWEASFVAKTVDSENGASM